MLSPHLTFILNSGGVGLTLAEWLIDGSPSRSMAALNPSRAMDHERSTVFASERGVESIGFHYGLHWPGRDVELTRNMRLSPIRQQLAKAGAVTRERAGWEVPMYFDPRPLVEREPAKPSIGWQQWSPLVQQECLAASDSVAVLDQSMYAKLLVQGPDALRALQWVSGANIDIAVGQTVYTQFLNANGGIEADVTILRMATAKFMVITGHPAQVHDRLYIERNADASWNFEVFDATSAFALVSIHGPGSRQLLEQLSFADVSKAALPFGSAKEIDLLNVRGWAIRRSYVGELGFELLIPTESAEHVARGISCLSPAGGRFMGMYALNACRLEKGFRHFGHDIADEDTPLETGLVFSVDFSKPDFLGKSALEGQRAMGPTQNKTIAVSVPGLSTEKGPHLIHNEPIWRGTKMVGYVTSGGWGWRLGKMIGLATVYHPGGVSKDWLAQDFDVQIAGQRYPIEVSLKPFYDPAGKLMRG